MKVKISNTMSFNAGILNIRNFWSTNKKKTTKGIFRVTVVEFENKCNLNCGLKFAELLRQNSLLHVAYFNEPFSKNFLNLQGRNFFDLIDRGNKILSGTQSDIVIWGYEEDGKIRINFQIANQYVIPNQLSFSLLDSLFIPLSFFSDTSRFSESMLLLIYGIIIAAINPVTNEQVENKPKILQEIITLLASDNSQKDISKEFMPYIMNMLGKIYLTNVLPKPTKNDVKIIFNLFDNALKNKQLMRLPIYYGCIYNNLGQLFEIAYNSGENGTEEYLKKAISNYQEALKFLNRNYPYDFGLTSYHLARLYFEYWKHTTDLQALRDAVSQLRNSEKIYSLAQFPQSWGHIEGLLGYYLTSLGMSTQSNEIMLMAINCYKNQQKIYEQNIYPVEWAKIQEEIGHIYYLLGKQNEDETFMLEAKNYFNSAMNIYQNLNMKNEIKETELRLLKVQNYVP